jgi:hypothetical protein
VSPFAIASPVNAGGREEYVAIPVGAFAEPSFPSPTVSVYEERMHSWVQMPKDIEHKE